MIAVIIPAHNEAAWLPRCLASVKRAAAHPAVSDRRVTTFVALDTCTDDSQAIVERLGATPVVVNARNVGRARACAADMALACGHEWLACTDADSEVPFDWLAEQWRWRHDAAAEAVCGTVLIDDWSARSARCRSAYEQAYDARDGHRHMHGANMALSARAYTFAGGFPPLTSGEDVALIRRLIELNVNIAWPGLPAVRTSARADHRAPAGCGNYLNLLESGAV